MKGNSSYLAAKTHKVLMENWLILSGNFSIEMTNFKVLSSLFEGIFLKNIF